MNDTIGTFFAEHTAKSYVKQARKRQPILKKKDGTQSHRPILRPYPEAGSGAAGRISASWMLCAARHHQIYQEVS